MLNQSSQSQENQGKGRKTSIIIALLLLLAVVTIGYASLSATLNINGTSKIRDNTWNVSPSANDIECPQGEVCTINPENPTTVNPDDGTGQDPTGAVIWMDGNTIYFKHILTEPGDTFTFTCKFKNNGSINAKVASVTKTELTETQAKFLTYDVTYADGTPVAANDPLNVDGSHTFKVTVTYKNVDTLPTPEEYAQIQEFASLFTVNYEQA